MGYFLGLFLYALIGKRHLVITLNVGLPFVLMFLIFDENNHTHALDVWRNPNVCKYCKKRKNKLK